jgi:hypothetical protein
VRDELSTICGSDLAELLLFAHDVGRFCSERGIPLAARGSATSSLVVWALGLSELCPLDYGLDGRMFCHEGRDDLPDLDLEVSSLHEAAVSAFVQHGGTLSSQSLMASCVRCAISQSPLTKRSSWFRPVFRSIATQSPGTIGTYLDVCCISGSVCVRPGPRQKWVYVVAISRGEVTERSAASLWSLLESAAVRVVPVRRQGLSAALVIPEADDAVDSADGYIQEPSAHAILT